MEKEQNNDKMNQIIDKVSSSCNTLENEVKEKIPDSFQVLADLELLPNSLKKLEHQINDLISSYKSIEKQLEPYKTTKDTSEDQKVNAEALMEAIPKFDTNTLNELIDFLKANKNSETKLIDLILNSANAEELFILLRKVFGEEDKLNNVSKSDYEKVQKKLSEAIMNNNLILE